ncbi:hypothetical protein [Histidinibacterium aquaticum]|uniref:Uncharacterized protein n=1 Tax=Histidinibacterium aquaticum TaxID=2613962 RepID=A0A5J5GC06_9RHOB|nr:hypothetical protein [Histidinibacterium aquaticum]KAA9005686.1 hypothetical protein F3S47_17455 [Histidinibacterium aquaticum]
MRDELDPKGLIAEAYRIEGIAAEECRSIFFDWALSLPDGQDPREAVTVMLERHGQEGHPMTAVLREGASEPLRRGRRGGASGRRG